MTKKIYLEPAWRMHSGEEAQFSHPPHGYEFVIPNGLSQRTVKALSNVGPAYSLLETVNKAVPLILIKAHLERLRRRPQGTSLTYSLYHLVFRREPWVIELENICNLSGGNAGFLKRHRRFFEATLASPWCKKIIAWSDTTVRSLFLNLDCSRFAHKIEKVPLTTSKKSVVKDYNKDKVKLLFVNSANILGNFKLKGGQEVLEAFARLRRQYDNIELVIRSDMPNGLRDKYRGLPDVRFIEERLPFELLEREYATADIFLAPGYMMAVWAILEAMSYELPVVATDIACAGEFVEQGQTGFILQNSRRVPCYEDNLFLPPQARLRARIQTADPDVVAELVTKTSILIENPELRRQMAAAGRHEIEQGRLSIESRSEKLKRILDEATA